MKKEKSKKKNRLSKKNKMSIFLYMLSTLFLAYTVFATYDTYNYVNQLVSYGNIDMSTQMPEVISYYVSTLAPFIFYTVVTWSMGYIINKINCISNHLMPTNIATDVIKEVNTVEEINKSSTVNEPLTTEDKEK